MRDYTEKTIRNCIESITDKHPIIKALAENRLCFFLGAGASMYYRLPGWPEFAKSYLNGIIKTVNQKKLVINDYTAKKLIDAHTDPMGLLSICESLVEHHKLYDVREIILNEIFNIQPEKIEDVLSRSNVYQLLKDIGAKYITTNYDNLFDHLLMTIVPSVLDASTSAGGLDTKKGGDIYWDKHILSEGKKLASRILDGDIVHIHGCIREDKKCNNMVITREDYLERYYRREERDNQYTLFLKEIFNTYTVVFIGYGLNELEILKYMFQSTSDVSAMDRFVLLDAYPIDYNYIEIYNNYLGKYNVDIIPYDKTDRGYDGIVPILKKIRDTKAYMPELTAADLNFILKEEW